MTTITAPDSLKMLRETFCVAQTQIWMSDDPRSDEHVKRLGRLIADIDRQRPLGPAVRHVDLHAADCGCDAPEADEIDPQEAPDAAH